MKSSEVISSIGYDQYEIIRNIVSLHTGDIYADVTYSKGVFYSKADIAQPTLKFDLFPQTPDTIQATSDKLPVADGSIPVLMYDPPFVVGHTKDKPTGIIGERFHGFRYIADLWEWYSKCIVEFSRVIPKGGWLIIKCQDTVSSGKQWFSHVHIMNEATANGFYCKDMFVLLAKSRIIGHNHSNQQHARKFHSYFLVFQKK